MTKDQKRKHKQFKEETSKDYWKNFHKRWHSGIMELKRDYNRVTKTKTFDNVTGELLIKMNNDYLFSHAKRRPR